MDDFLQFRVQQCKPCYNLTGGVRIYHSTLTKYTCTDIYLLAHYIWAQLGLEPLRAWVYKSEWLHCSASTRHVLMVFPNFSWKFLGLLRDNLRTLIVFVDELQDVRNLFLLRIVGSLLRQASLFHRIDVRLVITLRARPKWKCQNGNPVRRETPPRPYQPLEERLWNEHKQYSNTYLNHTAFFSSWPCNTSTSSRWEAWCLYKLCSRSHGRERRWGKCS